MTSFSPRFVRAQVSFKYAGSNYRAGEHLINASGLPGFKWKEFSPMEHLGKRVQVAVQVHTASPWEFHCDALITCERSAGSTDSCLGLTFLLSDADRARLNADVFKEGLLPDYVRKFPRIHFLPEVTVFPSRALVRFFYSGEDVAVSCDVENISPTGFLVYTDDARTEALLADETVRVQLQPRGQWLRQINVNAQVKRVTHTVEPTTGIVRRYFGLAFTTMSAEAKINFTDLLKQIVLQVKK
ncbi:MAG: PilZ domain-containing protein [Deltaproteobacteria bacterium]|nr:PilZ domain-containing protein [Deltaproteobacteria bacterium]